MRKPLLYFSVITFFQSTVVTAASLSSLYHKADSLGRIDPLKAAYYCQEAIKIAKNNNDSIALTQFYSKYSYCSTLLGDFDLALSNCYDAMDNCPKDNLVLTAHIENQMGSLYSTLKDYSKANELLESAQEKFRILNDSLGMANNNNLRGLMYVYLDDNKNAELYFRKALEINRKFNYRQGITGNINNMCLYNSGDWKEKVILLKEAIEINRKENAQWSLGENYNNLAMQYYYGGEYESALLALQKAFPISQKLKAKELISDNQYYSSLVYAAMQDYKQAYNTLSVHHKSLAELGSEKRLRQIEREILSRRIELIKKEALIKEQGHAISIWKTRAIIFFLTGFILLLYTIFVYKWRARKKKLILTETKWQLEQYERELTEIKLKQKNKELRLVNDELHSNKQELTEIALMMNNHIEILDKIKEMVKQGYRLDQEQTSVHLKKIAAFITQYKASNICMKKIQEKVEVQNQEFILRLTEKYPNITPNEKQLASLLRMNISTKEICIITGSAPKAVTMGRYRLRKRLNLKPEADLSIHLQQI
ncbi:MAG: tetratricopeptide repeat protein [Bacteroidales bacterium]